jgi:hypothetical protein
MPLNTFDVMRTRMLGGLEQARAAAAARAEQPGTIEYAAAHGMTPSELAEQVSRIKSESAFAANRAIQGLTATGRGYVDPNVLAAIQGEVGAAETASIGGLEQLNTRMMEENRRLLDELRHERKRRFWNSILGVASLFAGGWGGKAAKAATAATAANEALNKPLGSLEDIKRMFFGTTGAAASNVNTSPEDLEDIERILGVSSGTTGAAAGNEDLYF